MGIFDKYRSQTQEPAQQPVQAQAPIPSVPTEAKADVMPEVDTRSQEREAMKLSASLESAGIPQENYRKRFQALSSVQPIEARGAKKDIGSGIFAGRRLGESLATALSAPGQYAAVRNFFDEQKEKMENVVRPADADIKEFQLAQNKALSLLEDKRIESTRNLEQGIFTDEDMKKTAADVANIGVQVGSVYAPQFTGLKGVSQIAALSGTEAVLGGTEAALSGIAEKGEVNTADVILQGGIASVLPVGGAVAGKAIRKFIAPTVEELLKKSEVLNGTLDSLSGRIGWNKTKEGMKAQRDAINLIDTTDVKTYDNLSDKYNEKIQVTSSLVDKKLKEIPGVKKLDDFTQEIKVGDTVVKANYVQTAIDDLKKLYNTNKTKLAGILEVERIAKTEGLNKFQTNNLSRLYGSELSGFTKAGVESTSVTKQSHEDVRKALKSIVREGIDDTVKLLDEETSKLLNAKLDIDKMVENAQGIINKAKEARRPLYDAARKGASLLVDTLDIVTAGGMRGVLGALGSSGFGNKTMDSLSAQKELAKNLKMFSQIMEKIQKNQKLIESDKKFMTTLSKQMKSNQLKPVPTQSPQSKLPKSMKGILEESASLQPTTTKTLSSTPTLSKADDLVKQGIIKPEEKALAEEALKFDSLDEFVGSQGKPLYHGTNRDFTEFNINKSFKARGDSFDTPDAMYFSEAPEVSNKYANANANASFDEEVISEVAQKDPMAGKVLENIHKLGHSEGWAKSKKDLGSDLIEQLDQNGIDPNDLNDISEYIRGAKIYSNNLDESGLDMFNTSTTSEIPEVILNMADRLGIKNIPRESRVIDTFLDKSIRIKDLGNVENPKALSISAKKEGFDGVRFTTSESVEGAPEVAIWNTDKIKTKSQLTDLYNKAHSKK
tara:strand:+ start:229 stop:2901 length:2673 start_codon:yes stop_codon:yes gene_type:complete